MRKVRLWIEWGSDGVRWFAEVESSYIQGYGDTWQEALDALHSQAEAIRAEEGE